MKERRRTGPAALAALSLALLVGSAGAMQADAAEAADQDSATGLTAATADGRLQLTWMHSARTLESQGVDWTIVGSPRGSSPRDSIDLETDATGTTLDLRDRSLLGGREYAYSVYSIFRDEQGVEQIRRSDQVIVRTPERVSPGLPKQATCAIDMKRFRFSARIPASRTQDTVGAHTVLGRTVELRRNGRLVASRRLADNVPTSVVFRIAYKTSGKDAGGGAYALSYRTETPAGPSPDSSPCRRGLWAPTPNPFWISSGYHDGVITATWSKATSPVVPVTQYRVAWDRPDGTRAHRTIPASAARTISVEVGSAKRMDIAVIAVNRYGGTRLRQIDWFKQHGVWHESV